MKQLCLHRLVAGLGVVALAMVGLTSVGSAAEAPKKHRVVFQVNTADEGTQQTAVSNMKNVIDLYGRENVEIELVTYGPGLGMIMKQNEKMAKQLPALHAAGVKFVACGNTMERLKVKKEDLVDFAFVVKAGVPELIEKQEQGWAYIRP